MPSVWSSTICGTAGIYYHSTTGMAYELYTAEYDRACHNLYDGGEPYKPADFCSLLLSSMLVGLWLFDAYKFYNLTEEERQRSIESEALRAAMARASLREEDEQRFAEGLPPLTF